MPKTSPFSTKKFHGPKEIGHRLLLIRLAYGQILQLEKELSQAEFARILDIGTQAWNNAEIGYARIGIDNAIKLRRKTGAPLDYIYEGDEAKLPGELAREIHRVRSRALSVRQA